LIIRELETVESAGLSSRKAHLRSRWWR